MSMMTFGVAMLALTVALFLWGVPHGDQPTRVPNKWGLRTAFPVVLLCLGIVSLVLILKGYFP